MGVIAVSALIDPFHDVLRCGIGEPVAVQDIDDDCVIAIGGELVGHELGVLPDAENIGDVEQGGTIVLLALGLGHVGVVLADLDGLAGGLAAMKVAMTRSAWCLHAHAVKLGVGRLELGSGAQSSKLKKPGGQRVRGAEPRHPWTEQ